MDKFKALQEFEGIKENFCIKNMSSFKTGGTAKAFYLAREKEELIKLLKIVFDNKIPFRVIGGGSNLLFNDGDIDLLVIRMATNSIERKEQKVIVDSGVSLGRFLHTINKHGVMCMDGLTGVPGTIGGAIYGNAGAYGIEISEFLESVEVLHPEKGFLSYKKDELEYKYRNSYFVGKDYTILSAIFDFPQLTEDKIKQTEDKERKEILLTRMKKHPRSWSAGSFFKNPEGDKSAGYLIDKAGLKGFKVGDAMVSFEHGNFLINAGNASAQDIFNLKEQVKDKIKEKWDIDLEEEIKFIGF